MNTGNELYRLDVSEGVSLQEYTVSTVEMKGVCVEWTVAFHCVISLAASTWLRAVQFVCKWNHSSLEKLSCPEVAHMLFENVICKQAGNLSGMKCTLCHCFQYWLPSHWVIPALCMA